MILFISANILLHLKRPFGGTQTFPPNYPVFPPNYPVFVICQYYLNQRTKNIYIVEHYEVIQCDVEKPCHHLFPPNCRPARPTVCETRRITLRIHRITPFWYRRLVTKTNGQTNFLFTNNERYILHNFKHECQTFFSSNRHTFLLKVLQCQKTVIF